MGTNTRLILLLLGAGTGLLLAASGLLERWRYPLQELPPDVVARVGTHEIPRSRYLELLSDLAADKQTPLTGADHDFALQRLIDEELLIQRGVELNLADSSPTVRKAIASAVIAQLAAESEAVLPSQEALRELYESDAEFFATTSRYRLHWWRIPGADERSIAAAREAATLLKSGQGDEGVENATGMQRQQILPDTLLPPSKLADYLGPGLARQVPLLESGQVSAPIELAGDTHILMLLEREAGGLPEFETLKPVLLDEYRRRAGDEALRAYLSRLRERTDIVVNKGETP